MSDSTRRARVVTWAVRIGLAAVFLNAGVEKFSDNRLWLRVFQEIGFGEWFRYFTGVVEVAGALLLLVPRATYVAVALLVCTMIGALLVHVLIMGVAPQTAAVGVLIALLCAVAVRRRRETKPRERPPLVGV